nr:hypothetical protein Itr_chr08CG14730 [Ipomoea trifida]
MAGHGWHDRSFRHNFSPVSTSSRQWWQQAGEWRCWAGSSVGSGMLRSPASPLAWRLRGGKPTAAYLSLVPVR